MTVSVTVQPMGSWPAPAVAALSELSDAVYPPRESGEWEGSSIEWSRPEWGVRVLDDQGRLVSYAGLQLRDAAHDANDVLIGGVGGVKTHPDFRGRGHAGLAMRATVDFFVENAAHFGLLVCAERLIPYYEQLGWQLFHGDLVTLQRGEPAVFIFNRVMVVDAGGPAPRDGVIDLHGPPW